MKPMTKQLALAAFILTSVTVLSFGIRQVRLSVHRANSIETPVIADTGESKPTPAATNRKDSPQPEQLLHANAEPDHQPADSHIFDIEADPQQANASDAESIAHDHFKSNADSPKYDKTLSMTKSFKGDYAKFKGDYPKLKGDYAKSKGSKGLQKIPVSDHENIYVTEKGERWYVSENPDGTVTKVQMQTDDIETAERATKE